MSWCRYIYIYVGIYRLFEGNVQRKWEENANRLGLESIGNINWHVTGMNGICVGVLYLSTNEIGNLLSR